MVIVGDYLFSLGRWVQALFCLIWRYLLLVLDGSDWKMSPYYFDLAIVLILLIFSPSSFAVFFWNSNMYTNEMQGSCTSYCIDRATNPADQVVNSCTVDGITPFGFVTRLHVECIRPSDGLKFGGNFLNNNETPKYFITSPAPPKQCPREGNPCNPATGNKFQVEQDRGLGISPEFTRYYQSQGVGDGFQGTGEHWRHSYSRRMDGYPATPSYLNYLSLKSNLYGTPDSACTSGWTEIKNRTFRGLLANATVVYQNELCQIIQGNKVVANLPVYTNIFFIPPIQTMADC